MGFLKDFEDELKWRKNDFGGTDLTDTELRKIFILEYFFDWYTYDDAMSIYFADILIDALCVIENKTWAEYIKDETNYKNYLMALYIFNQNYMIEWGTSIRSCWIKYNKTFTEEVINWICETKELK